VSNSPTSQPSASSTPSAFPSPSASPAVLPSPPYCASRSPTCASRSTRPSRQPEPKSRACFCCKDGRETKELSRETERNAERLERKFDSLTFGDLDDFSTAAAEIVDLYSKFVALQQQSGDSTDSRRKVVVVEEEREDVSQVVDDAVKAAKLHRKM